MHFQANFHPQDDGLSVGRLNIWEAWQKLDYRKQTDTSIKPQQTVRSKTGE
jgi:hypothetical protein